MISRIFRIIWRIVILFIIVGLSWVTYRYLWPYLDHRFPSWVVIFLLYLLVAYVFIPAIFRLWRVVFTPNHIPLYASTGDGWSSDPVNLAILAKDKNSLIESMTAAGWYVADPPTLKNSIREAASILFNHPYPNAPMSTLFLFNRRHDIAFEIPTNHAMSARTRHHVRFWRLEEPAFAHPKELSHYEFWSAKLKRFVGGESEVWIGAATEDYFPIGIRVTGQITHGVSHESDRERDYIIDTLKKSKLVKSVRATSPGEEIRFRGQQFRTVFITDGSIKVVRLK